MLLLLNDFILKRLYGNWLTGKLSDFAGLFIFSLFWSALFPKHKITVLGLTGLLFILWKSPFSQGIIEFWNGLEVLPVARVVDYTDLIALIVLPVAYYTHDKNDKIKRIKISPIIPLILAAFSFMATSYSTNVPINKSYSLNYPKDTLVNRIAKIDSLNFGYGVLFSDHTPDTVEIRLPSKFCFEGFDVTVSIAELNENIELTLIKAEHGCPGGKEDRKKLIQEFERVIISNIKTRPNPKK